MQSVESEEGREGFKREAVTSWAEYQDTHLHLTADEMSAWLKTWGTEAEMEPPGCHE